MGPSSTDAVWIYSLTYGGGIVSVCSIYLSLFVSHNYKSFLGFVGYDNVWYWVQGDSISCELTVGDGCTAVLTTQASTKVDFFCFSQLVLHCVSNLILGLWVLNCAWFCCISFASCYTRITQHGFSLYPTIGIQVHGSQVF